MNKKIWITGASDGIGKSLALLFANKGYSLVLSGRDRKKTEQVAELCRDEIKKIVGIEVSVEIEVFDCNNIGASIEASKKVAKNIDWAIFCAGISQRDYSFNLDAKDEITINNVNFLSPIMTSKILLSTWKNLEAKNSEKRIIFVSSIASHLPTPLRAMYGSSKAALEHYAKTARNELTKNNIKNILISTIIPGFVKTDISKKAILAGDKHWGKMDKNQNQGISAERAAILIHNAIKQNKKEYYVGMSMSLKIIVFIAKKFPRLADNILSKVNTA